MTENNGDVEYHATVLNNGALDEQRSFAILDHIKSDVGTGNVLPESRLTLIHGGAPSDFAEGGNFIVSIRAAAIQPTKRKAEEQAAAVVEAVNAPPVPAAETNAIEERRAADQDAAMEAAFVDGTLPEVDRRHEDQGEGAE